MNSTTKIGSYLIEGPIGRGGMGVVYKGRHATLPREVAVKSINAREGSDLRHLRQRFEREAFVQSQLDHPGIVKIYDYIVSEHAYYIVMEYVEGRSLAELLAREDGPLPVERALDLFEQILAAVAYAHSFTYRDEDGATHRGIIHRDLKPHNVIVTPDDRAKVTDFGIVKLVGADTSDTSGLAYGTPRYISPEQAADAHVDQRSDIYALGVMLYECLTGEPPFGGKGENLSPTQIMRAHVERAPRPPSELNLDVTPELERVVCRALDKKPERRHASAREFLVAVRRARGRDTGDLAPHAGVNSQAGAGDASTGEFQRTTAHVRQDTYTTQPIHASRCEVCEAETEPDDTRCRACGHDLTASPATATLTRHDITSRRRARGIRIAVAVAALAASLAAAYVALRRTDAPRLAQSPTPAPSASPQATRGSVPPVPPASLVELRPASVEVDSSFDGYDAVPLTDGVTDVRRVAAMRYNRGNWASAETPVPHWIVLGFERPTRVAAVYVYWGFDRTRYVPSRRVELQTPDERGEWRTISTIETRDDYDRAAFEFAPVEVSRLRIFQPAQQGPTGRPFVMWVREVQVFGVAVAANSPS